MKSNYVAIMVFINGLGFFQVLLQPVSSSNKLGRQLQDIIKKEEAVGKAKNTPVIPQEAIVQTARA